jgi:hypothetical protein
VALEQGLQVLRRRLLMLQVLIPLRQHVCKGILYLILLLFDVPAQANWHQNTYESARQCD